MSAEHHQAPSGGSTVPLFPTPREPRPQSVVTVAPQPVENDGETFTRVQLQEQAVRAAGALARLGVGGGDRVAVLLPMGLESVVATLACVRLDASRVTLPLHGQPLTDLRSRLVSTRARVVVTADACLRDRAVLPLKSRLDRALADTEVRHVLVVRHLPRPVPWTPGRDRWWHQALAAAG